MLFDKNGIIKRYESPEHILTEFFELRLEFYSKRRTYLIQVRICQRQVQSSCSARLTRNINSHGQPG